MKTVIEMAREAEFHVQGMRVFSPMVGGSDLLWLLERFAALVRADERNSWPAEMEAMERQVNILTDALAEERERMKWDVHSCGPTCKRYACVALREAVEAEREACAKVCEEIYTGEESMGDWPTPEMCAEAIRARGSKT